MDTKLTLKLDQEVIEATKQLAARRGVSLSRLVETYFRGLNVAAGEPRIAPTGLVAELAGIAAGGNADDGKGDYAEYLDKKYA